MPCGQLPGIRQILGTPCKKLGGVDFRATLATGMALVRLVCQASPPASGSHKITNQVRKCYICMYKDDRFCLSDIHGFAMRRAEQCVWDLVSYAWRYFFPVDRVIYPELRSFFLLFLLRVDIHAFTTFCHLFELGLFEGWFSILE